MSQLPPGWAATTIGEVADLSSGFGFAKHLQGKQSGRFPFAKVGDISKAVRDNAGQLSVAANFVDDDDLKILRAKPVPAGSTVFAKIGEALKLNRRALTTKPFVLDNNCMAASPKLCVEPGFLFLYFRTVDLSPFSVATTVPSVRKGDVESVGLGLPPLPEQRRIVAKVDSLSSKSKRAREHLDHIPRLVEKYKQAVLAAAFRGELSQSLKIESDRSALPSDKLCTLRESRSAHRKFSRKQRCIPDFQTELPKSWIWVSPDELSDDSDYSIGIGPFGSNLVRADYRDQGVRLVFVRDISSATFGDVGARFVTSEKAAELHQHMVLGGDLLIAKMGDPPGSSALYPLEAPPAVITADCIKLRPHPALALVEYLLYAMQSIVVREQILEITKGVAQQKVSLERFRTIAIPIAPLAEQDEIVRRIASLFAWIDRLAAEATSARKLIDRLDQAVLAKAFRGELVPQDPDDEPASVLLERIRSERETAPAAKPRRGRVKRS